MRCARITPTSTGPEVSCQVTLIPPAMNRKPWKYSLERTYAGLHQDSVSCLAFSPCGQFLASCGKGRVCIYSVSRSKVIRYYDIVDASPVALTWGDTADDLYVGYSDGHLWQYQRPTQGGVGILRRLLILSSNKYSSLEACLHVSSHRLICGSLGFLKVVS